MQLPLSQKLFYFFPVLFCFCLPFGSLILSAIIVMWLVVSFFNLRRADFSGLMRSRPAWLLMSFFILTGISALLSEDRNEAIFSVEVKMSFILLPYLFYCFHWPGAILKRCVVSFVSGCFFACLYLILRAFLYSFYGHPEYFFYSLFSDFIHTSYFSMYLMMAIVFVLVLYPKWFSLQKSVIYSSYFFVAIFAASIFLCSSKLGIISFFVCGFILLLYRWKLRLRLLKIVLVCCGLVLSVLVAYLAFPSAFARLESLTAVSSPGIDKTSAESTAVRVLIWEQAFHIVRDNFWLGTGVGDANNALYASYEKAGMTGASALRLNAHNQYLQTFIGMGIIGFLLLVLMTFGEMIRALLQRRFLLFVFSLLILMNFLVESMLQRSAGVLFFTFFFCFLHLVDEEQLADNKQIE